MFESRLTAAIVCLYVAIIVLSLAVPGVLAWAVVRLVLHFTA